MLEEVWPTIHSNIKETSGLTKWGSSDLYVGLEEAIILRNWEIGSIPGYVGNIGEVVRTGNSVEIWEPPPINMFNLNFDGASKGNLGSTDFGGAI